MRFFTAVHEVLRVLWLADSSGSGATLEEEDQAGKVKTDHLLRIHHVLPRDAEIAGML
jgi:hypothetical protein